MAYVIYVASKSPIATPVCWGQVIKKHKKSDGIQWKNVHTLLLDNWRYTYVDRIDTIWIFLSWNEESSRRNGLKSKYFVKMTKKYRNWTAYTCGNILLRLIVRSLAMQWFFFRLKNLSPQKQGCRELTQICEVHIYNSKYIKILHTMQTDNTTDII